jgi:hypothetical protein
LRGAGVVSAERLGVGFVRVTFDGAVSGCGWTATVNDNDRGGAASAEITVELGGLDNQLFVKTWKTNDGSAWEVDLGGNDGFTVMAICP